MSKYPAVVPAEASWPRLTKTRRNANTTASTAETTVMAEREAVVFWHREGAAGNFTPGANLRVPSAASRPSGASAPLSFSIRLASSAIKLRTRFKCVSSHCSSTLFSVEIGASEGREGSTAEPAIWFTSRRTIISARVLREREFEAVGSTRTTRVDVRVVAATNQDLNQMVLDGEFRQDLYFRLNVFPIYLPPLRGRKADIPELVEYFVQQFAASMYKKIEA